MNYIANPKPIEGPDPNEEDSPDPKIAAALFEAKRLEADKKVQASLVHFLGEQGTARFNKEGVRHKVWKYQGIVFRILEVFVFLFLIWNSKFVQESSVECPAPPPKTGLPGLLEQLGLC